MGYDSIYTVISHLDMGYLVTLVPSPTATTFSSFLSSAFCMLAILAISAFNQSLPHMTQKVLQHICQLSLLGLNDICLMV